MNPQLSKIKGQLFQNIFDFACGGIAIVGLKGEWVKVSDSIVHLLGYSKEELYKTTVLEITHKDDLNIDLSYMSSLIRGDIKNYQTEKRYFHKNGSILWALLSVSIVRDDNGRPMYFISQVHDISEQKSTEEQLQVMLNLTEEQNQRLTSFADIITHNLRTHTSNLLTLYGFLEDEVPQLLAQSENFEFLKKSISNLSETVSHLTEIAKTRIIDEDKIKSLNLRTYVKKGIYNVSATVKDMTCSIENAVKPEHFVKAVPAYLDSVILNFLSNAIKYRSEERDTKIELSSEILDEYAVLHIKDNGLGIDLKNNGDKLFHLYKTFHKNKDSIGIGLFITRNQIESMGGYVKVESTVNVGTKFSIYLKQS